MAAERAALPILLALALAVQVRGEAPQERLDFRYQDYGDANDVTDRLGSLLFIKALGKGLFVRWEQTLDAVTGASRSLGKGLRGQPRPGDYDAVTGASPTEETRHATRASLEYARRDASVAVSGYLSREDDYFSVGEAASVSRDFQGGATTLAASAERFQDDFRPQGAYAGLGGRKRILSLSLQATRLLGPLSLVDGEIGWGSYDGYLGHPYLFPVATDGTLLTENLPSGRRTISALGRIVGGYRLGYLLGSVSLASKAYSDDWGLRAADLDLLWSQHFSETGYVRLRARGYGQTGASFAGIPAPDQLYRTADVRLFPFRSLLLGAKLAAGFPEAWDALPWLPDHWDVGYEWLVRDTPGDGLGDITPAAAGGAPAKPRLYQLYPADRWYRQRTWSVGVGFDL